MKAVLLLFPTTGNLETLRKKEDEDGLGKFSGDGVWWVKQTVSGPSAWGSSRKGRSTLPWDAQTTIYDTLAADVHTSLPRRIVPV